MKTLAATKVTTSAASKVSRPSTMPTEMADAATPVPAVASSALPVVLIQGRLSGAQTTVPDPFNTQITPHCCASVRADVLEALQHVAITASLALSWTYLASQMRLGLAWRYSTQRVALFVASWRMRTFLRSKRHT